MFFSAAMPVQRAASKGFSGSIRLNAYGAEAAGVSSEGIYMLPVFDDTAVAKDIEAVCSKCGESWHVIVAVSDGKIAKVQCKSCGGYHKYRPIATDRMSLKRNTKSAIAASTAEGSPLPKSKSAKSSEPKVAVAHVSANDRPVRPYSIKSVDYMLGDRIEHVKFGAGIVDEFPAPGKMYVTFAHERILLVYGK